MPKGKLNLYVFISVEFYTENGKQFMFISSENSSGCKYEIKNLADVGKVMQSYVENNI